MEKPLNSIVYLQYGAMHQSFIEAAREDAVGVIVSTMIGLLRDEIGTPQVGCQSYSSMHHYALAATLAGGTGGPGDFERNRSVAARLRETIFRSVVGHHPLSSRLAGGSALPRCDP